MRVLIRVKIQAKFRITEKELDAYHFHWWRGTFFCSFRGLCLHAIVAWAWLRLGLFLWFLFGVCFVLSFHPTFPHPSPAHPWSRPRGTWPSSRGTWPCSIRTHSPAPHPGTKSLPLSLSPASSGATRTSATTPTPPTPTTWAFWSSPFALFSLFGLFVSLGCFVLGFDVNVYINPWKSIFWKVNKLTQWIQVTSSSVTSSQQIWYCMMLIKSYFVAKYALSKFI